MKKQLTMIIIAVLLIGLSGYTQSKDTIVANMTAGNELLLSSKCSYGALACGVIGTCLISYGNRVEDKYKLYIDKDYNSYLNARNSTIYYLSGGAILIVSAAFIFESINHKKNAGLILNENGIGIRYKL